ncbi:MAG: DUF5421 family protein [Chlamydiales bacterium]
MTRVRPVGNIPSEKKTNEPKGDKTEKEPGKEFKLEKKEKKDPGGDIQGQFGEGKVDIKTAGTQKAEGPQASQTAKQAEQVAKMAVVYKTVASMQVSKSGDLATLTLKKDDATLPTAFQGAKLEVKIEGKNILIHFDFPNANQQQEAAKLLALAQQQLQQLQQQMSERNLTISQLSLGETVVIAPPKVEKPFDMFRGGESRHREGEQGGGREHRRVEKPKERED